MIKVECVSCKAPYELDERRIPDKGMKMRCPKCGTSFMVTKQGASPLPAAGAAAPAPPPASAAGPIAVPPPAARPPTIAVPPAAGSLKGTIAGVANPSQAVPLPASPSPVAAPKMKTAVGVAPPSAEVPKPPMGSLAPPPNTTGPAAAVAAVTRQATPNAVSPPASNVNRSAAAKGAFGATTIGTAAPAAARAPIAPPLSGGFGSAASGIDLPADLPAPKAPADAADLSVSRIYVEDLPAPKREVDLPAPRAAIPVGPTAQLTPPKPAAGKAPIAAPPMFGEIDLPAPKPAAIATAFSPPASAAGPQHVDLPAPKLPGPGLSPPKAPMNVVDLPTPKGGGFDLPQAKAPQAFAELDLPAPKVNIDLPVAKAPTASFGDLELPMLKSPNADLPVAKQPGGFGELDLPTPKGLADLPVAKPLADLPTPKGFADLPVAFGGGDLPRPTDPGRISLDLPAPKNDLPVPKGDEASFADLDLDLPDLPNEGAPPRGFGDIELPPPRPASNLVSSKARTVQGHNAPALDAETSFGELGIEEDRDSDLPPSLLGDDESSFDQLNLEADPVPRPPAGRRPAPPPVDDVEEIEPDAQELGDDAFGESDDNFGEAAFDESDDADAEETEFGISGDEARGLGLPPEVLRKQRGEEFEAKQAALGKRALTILVRSAILLVVLIAGAAGLAFTKYGVFGIYLWERWLPEAGDPKFVHDAIVKAEKMAASDRYVDVRRALKELGEARRKAGINRELLTRSVVHEALYTVRFGDDPNSAGRTAAIMKRLAERSFEAPGMELARAADSMRRKQWRDAASQIDAARKRAPSDPYVELLAGEAALAEGKLPAAQKAFQRARKIGGGARAEWGLARVALMRRDVEAQNAAVNDTLKLSPMHVEARIAEARILWAQGKEDRAVQQLRVAIGLEPTEEDQYLWSSRSATSLGYSLLGWVHESKGRLHAARESYAQALSADPYRVEALLGSGRVLLREKRAADALARFESALSSATKGGDNPVLLSGRHADAEAQLGMSRALLALNRGPDAKTKLDALLKERPTDGDIVLAMGETEQALGHNELAESNFRKSIELDPKRFDPYLALSQLFFKEGDAAKASEVLNQAAAQVEETSEMRRMLGQSELARNRLESAIHEYQRALELDPQSVDAMFGMAIALRKSGDLDQASKTVEQIAVRDPGYAGLAEQRGLLFEARGQYADAVKAYRDALAKDPGDTSLLLRLGAAQVADGAFDAAEQTLEKVIKELPNSAEAEYFIGRIAFGRGRTPDALTHFDRAVSLDGVKAEYHLYVARASLEMANLGRALEETQAALNFDPSLGDAYWVRAVVRLRMGAVQDALKDLNKALKLNPGRVEALAVIGDCYEQLRELPEAIRSYRSALERNPARGDWWYRLSVLQGDAGNRGESDTSVRRALEIGDKTDPLPYWLPDAHRIAGENAEARGDRNTAIRLYKRYLEIAQPAAIDRTTIERRLKSWGVELTQEE